MLKRKDVLIFWCWTQLCHSVFEIEKRPNKMSSGQNDNHRKLFTVCFESGKNVVANVKLYLRGLKVRNHNSCQSITSEKEQIFLTYATDTVEKEHIPKKITCQSDISGMYFSSRYIAAMHIQRSTENYSECLQATHQCMQHFHMTKLLMWNTSLITDYFKEFNVMEHRQSSFQRMLPVDHCCFLNFKITKPYFVQ